MKMWIQTGILFLLFMASACTRFSVIEDIVPDFENQFCPNPSPLLCTDGSCQATASDCDYSDPCPGMVQCNDTSCVASPDLCPAANGCSAYICWDGECVVDPDLCSSVQPSCQIKNRRCPDGSCIAENDSCPSPPSCGPGETLCSSGLCFTSCPDFNGCNNDNVNLQCSTGDCVEDRDDCNRPTFTLNPTQSLCPQTQTLCRNGSCVATADDCEPALILTKPGSAIVFIGSANANQNVSEKFIADASATHVPSGSQELGGIQWTASTFQVDDIIQWNMIPDSELRRVTGSVNWNRNGISTSIRIRYSKINDTNPPSPFPLASPISLTFRIQLFPGAVLSRACLYFYDETASPLTWEIQDCNLIQSTDSEGNLFLTGLTDHFTSFGVLVETDGQSSGGDGDDSKLLAIVLSSVAAGLVILAIISLVVIILVILGIIAYKRERWQGKLRRASRVSTAQDQAISEALYELDNEDAL